MNNSTPQNKLHPLMTVAAVSVILASGVGIATMTGLLPHQQTPISSQPPIAITAPPSAPALVPAATSTIATVVKVPEPVKPVVKKMAAQIHHKAVTHKTIAHTENQAVSEDHYNAPPPVCMDCGTVLAVQPMISESKPSGIGAVGGAILGGVIGHQFGGGDGKKAMTAAGVVGGAMAGNQIEKSQHKITSYNVTVQMEDGSTRSFSYDTAPNFSSGEHVKVSGNRLISAN